MPAPSAQFSYEILPERQTIVTRYAGFFTLTDLLTSTRRLWADPRYSEKYNGLVDAADTGMGVEINDFRSLIEFVRDNPSASRGRWAIVTSTPLATVCGIIYQRAMAKQHTLEIFSTWEAACQFVNVEVRRDLPLGC